MATATIDARPYIGSLAAADLLSGSKTILLNKFGGSQNGTVVDDEGQFDTGDNGVTTFQGNPITYIGSGTVQPGVEVLGVIVPTGTPRDVVVYEAGGKIWFHFPHGEPNLAGAVAMIVTITPAPYQVFNPVCFTQGTFIRTPDGELPIEQLSAGDIVLDRDGDAHRVEWIGSCRMATPSCLTDQQQRWAPVRIERGAFGIDRPYKDLLVSQQHRIGLDDPDLEILFGIDHALAPAKSLEGPGVYIDRSVQQVCYFHILCAAHVVLVANGMPAESMLCGEQALKSLDPAAKAEIAELFPEIVAQASDRQMQSAAPILKVFEARLLRSRQATPPRGRSLTSAQRRKNGLLRKVA